MKPNELLDLFRKEVEDTEEPYLWSDEEFFIYLNDAQDVFVRLIGGIADRRSPLTLIPYKSGDQFKKYDPRILRIKGAFDENNNIITIRNLDNFEGPSTEDDYGRQINAGLDDGKTGDIKYLVTDVENNEFQLYPIPDHDGSIRLFVYRRPEEPISPAGNGELEIPEYHHINLLSWVKYRAYMKQDVEAFDGTQAATFRKEFTDWVTDARTEKRTREDRKRVVRYGGL